MSVTLGVIVGIVLALFLLGWIALEWQYRSREGNKLELTAGDWQLEVYEPQQYVLVGEMEFCNRTRHLEIMVPEVKVEVMLLSKESLEKVTWKSQIVPQHTDAEARSDHYWFAYIVKIGKTTGMQVRITIQGENLTGLQAAWVRASYVTYGPEGRIPKTTHAIVPLKFPTPDPNAAQWRPATNADVLPIRTHLLTHLDTPTDIVKRYVTPYAQPGDVVTIGETPIAIMQGRFRHPTEIQPGWLARRLCYYFLPTSSLATACGLQALVDIVGAWRVAFAFVFGSLARILLGKRGAFYQLAGEQARLIDDVTGTLPPYDQFVVLGPENAQAVVDKIKQETGLAAAIVDVNDLKAVKILAATSDVPPRFLEQALISNPAGNADEQTPIVLLRPSTP